MINQTVNEGDYFVFKNGTIGKILCMTSFDRCRIRKLSISGYTYQLWTTVKCVKKSIIRKVNTELILKLILLNKIEGKQK